MDTRISSYGFIVLISLAPLHIILAGKLSQNTALNGYNCNVSDVAFEKDNMNKLGCAALCDGSKACLGFFYKPDTSQCVGCKVWYTTNEKLSRTWSGSLCYEKQVCPNGGDIKRGRSCYFAAPMRLTFDGSTAYCKEHDAHVIQAETPDENTFLKAYLASLRNQGCFIWLGLTFRRIEGTWEWYSTGDPVKFQNWNDDQPNGKSEQNCVVFACDNGKWIAVDGDNYLMTLCETWVGE